MYFRPRGLKDFEKDLSYLKFDDRMGAFRLDACTVCVGGCYTFVCILLNL